MRRVILVLIALIIAASVYVGLREGPFLILRPENKRQLVVAIAQLLYGTSGVLALIGLAKRRFWAVGMAALWAAAAVIAAGFASVAWEDAGFLVALSAAAGTAVVTGAIVWYLHYLSRSWTQ